jgi:class 3 adenylate cyclase
MQVGATRYTTVGEAQVAYQVTGEGSRDLVVVSGTVSNIEMQWEYPPMARMLSRLASFSRLITFDRRGQGISDPLRFEVLPTWEHWTEDLTAVLDAAGSDKTSIIASVDGGPWALLFAATYPERTNALVLWNSYARIVNDADEYTIGQTVEENAAVIDTVEQLWGTEALAQLSAPEQSDDANAMRWLARYQRAASTPAATGMQMRYQGLVDARHVLPSVQVPTLVLHQENGFITQELSRYVADRIDNARFLEVPGSGVNLESMRPESLDIIEEFLTGVPPAQETDRVLATVLYTDIVGSTQAAVAAGDRRWKELLDQHDGICKGLIGRFGGRLIKSTGDGVLATFEAPGRALRCAHAMITDLSERNLDIRAGLHTGEIELREDGDIGGVAVHIGARVLSKTAPGEVWCSRTVRDLVVGSGFEFEDRGPHTLKGIPDDWQLFAVKES